MHIQLSNKVLNTVMQKQSIVRIFFYYDFYFLTIYIYHLHRAQMYIYQYPIDKICRQINCCKYLLQNAKNEKYYNLKKKKKKGNV